jgi:hypothetical protein
MTKILVLLYWDECYHCKVFREQIWNHLPAHIKKVEVEKDQTNFDLGQLTTAIQQKLTSGQLRGYPTVFCFDTITGKLKEVSREKTALLKAVSSSPSLSKQTLSHRTRTLSHRTRTLSQGGGKTRRKRHRKN